MVRYKMPYAHPSSADRRLYREGDSESQFSRAVCLLSANTVTWMALGEGVSDIMTDKISVIYSSEYDQIFIIRDVQHLDHPGRIASITFSSSVLEVPGKLLGGTRLGAQTTLLTSTVAVACHGSHWCALKATRLRSMSHIVATFRHRTQKNLHKLGTIC